MNRNIAPWIASVVLTLFAASRQASASDTAPAQAPVKWDASVFQVPTVTDAPGFTAEGVKAIFYSGVPFRGKTTRVFAWVGMPKLEPGKKAPGIVLVHGGGGTAFDVWVRLWTSRGYAAIAMDNCGQVPRGTYNHWDRDPQGGPAGWGGFGAIDEPVKDQWTYQAVADVILADSLLRSMPGVDADRVGMTGISWGGYLACIAAGLDDRLKFVAPIYGCGFLGEDSNWAPDFKNMGDEKSARWLSMWDPSVYLKQAAMPLLWVDGTNDPYPLNCLQKSYRLPTGPRWLCTTVRMPHGHGGAGENPPEIHAFADAVVAGGAPLSRITGQGRDERAVWATLEPTAPLAKAELNYTKETGIWKNRKWETIPATVESVQHKVTATLPEGTKVYFLNVFDSRGLHVSTEHVEIK